MLDEPRTETVSVFLVLMLSKVTDPPHLRADFRTFDNYQDAVSRQVDLGSRNGWASWIVGLPDPRNVAND